MYKIGFVLYGMFKLILGVQLVYDVKFFDGLKYRYKVGIKVYVKIFFLLFVYLN